MDIPSLIAIFPQSIKVGLIENNWPIRYYLAIIPEGF